MIEVEHLTKKYGDLLAEGCQLSRYGVDVNSETPEDTWGKLQAEVSDLHGHSPPSSKLISGIISGGMHLSSSELTMRFL